MEFCRRPKIDSSLRLPAAGKLGMTLGAARLMKTTR